jgi:hypothetical protein
MKQRGVRPTRSQRSNGVIVSTVVTSKIQLSPGRLPDFATMSPTVVVAELPSWGNISIGINFAGKLAGGNCSNH